MTGQPTLFENRAQSAEVEKILLYALGEFQARGKVLAARQLALDRLRAAFKRAGEKFGAAQLPDEKLAEGLQNLGAEVKRVPSFVAKHPFRVTVSKELADRAQSFYKTSLEND